MPVAQLDRVSDYESEGREFESRRARQFFYLVFSAPVAQWIEHRFPKPQVGRSSRLGRAIIRPEY